MSPRRPVPPYTQLVCPECDEPVQRQDPEDLERWRRQGVRCQACDRGLSAASRAILAKARSETGWEPGEALLTAAALFDDGALDESAVVDVARQEAAYLNGQ